MSVPDPHASRSPNVPGGRNVGRYIVKTDAAEDAALQKNAAAAGMTVARYLRETALGTVPQVKDTLAIHELQGIRRQVSGVANNLNQLAAIANSGMRWEDEIGLTLAEVNSASHKIDRYLSR